MIYGVGDPSDVGNVGLGNGGSIVDSFSVLFVMMVLAVAVEAAMRD